MAAYERRYIRACEAFGWEGGPEFSTEIVQMPNKREKRNSRWSQSRFFASLPFQNIRPEQYGNIVDMFEDRRGRWGGFLYRNRLRDTATNVQFAVGDGVKKEFQLAYINQYGRATDVTALYEPDFESSGEAVESAISASIDGAPASFTVNHDTGIVIFDAAPPPGSALSWSGSFSHWVRFDNDRLPFSIDSVGAAEGFFLNGSVEIVGLPPPRQSEVGS